jgi:hypothetical protein
LPPPLPGFAVRSRSSGSRASAGSGASCGGAGDAGVRASRARSNSRAKTHSARWSRVEPSYRSLGSSSRPSERSSLRFTPSNLSFSSSSCACV